MINLFHFAKAVFAVILFGYPARGMTVVGVTGTDGKTTTAHAIYYILKSAGFSASLISTTGAIISSDETTPVGLHVTTPSPFLLQRLIRRAKNTGSKHIVIEVTSHGLDQHRVLGCNFHVGVITNITHEHLDYHKTFENYLKTKSKLLSNVKYSILNLDDSAYEQLVELANGKVITYGMNNCANVAATNISYTHSGSNFEISAINSQIKTRLQGKFNIENLLAAASVGIALGIGNDQIAEGLERTIPPSGRLERIVAGQPFSVYVDFAHTPNAMANLLEFLRSIAEAKLIIVFGCAGERDMKKRRPMGEIAAKKCDYVVLTAEDPRTESVEQIIEEIAQGCVAGGGVKGESFFSIKSRQDAINYAIQNLAKKNDIVVVTGKAHEKSMCIGTEEFPWDEFKAVELALNGLITPKKNKDSELSP